MTRRTMIAAAAIAALLLLLAWCQRGDNTTDGPAPPPPVGIPVGDASPTTASGGAVSLPAPIPPKTATTVPHRPAPTLSRPKPVTTPPAPTPRALSSVEVAKRWTAAACQYSWQDPYGKREAAQARWSTPTLRRDLTPTEAGRADWQSTVVAGQVSSACRVDSAITMTAAPNTKTRTHVRVAVTTVVTRAGVPAVQSPGYWPLRLELVGNVWLVSGITAGG